MVPRICTQTFVLAAVLSAGAVFPALAADPTGDWQVEGAFANIRVAECSGAMWGVVAWEAKPGARDAKNPDPAKRTRPTLGMVTLFDMKKKAGSEAWDGEVYDAQFTGSRIRARMSVKSAGVLQIEGCPMGFCVQGQDWTRVAGPIPSSPTNQPRPAQGAMAATGAPAPKQPAAPKPPVPSGAKAAATPNQTPDIGDICLLPEITSAIATRGRQ